MPVEWPSILESELDARSQIWVALSDLWVDNEINFDAMTDSLVKGPYTWKEIEYIAFYEVAPVVGSNMYAVPGGVWTGFDPLWLRKEIICDQKRKNHCGGDG